MLIRMRDYIFPKLRSTISHRKLFPFPSIYIKDDEHVEVKSDHYVLKYCLKQIVPSDIDIERLKIDMKARYEFFSIVGIIPYDLRKEPISNLHVNKKFTSILFYSVIVYYEKILPNTIINYFGQELVLNENSKDYTLNGNINSIKLTVSGLYELDITPAKQLVPVVAEGGGRQSQKKLTY